MAWLEEQRPPVVTAVDLVREFDLTLKTADDVVRRMARKGWLNRVAQGRYEPLLAESGGVALPNPWAALASWQVPYYVGYSSAAYQLNLIPDRPGVVQTCVKKGTYPPVRFADLPLQLLPRQQFSLEATELVEVHRQRVRVASAELVLLDGAVRPSRVGGVFGLTRIVDRSLNHIDWDAYVDLAVRRPLGRSAARRVAAVLGVLGQPAPQVLARFASSKLPKRPMFLGDPEIHGSKGKPMKEFAIIVNIAPEVLLEEVRR